MNFKLHAHRMTSTITRHPPQLLAALERVTGDRSTRPALYSTLDVLWMLYDRVLRFDPADPDDPDRDRFLLSKGHGPAAYYAVLAAKGFIPADWLDEMGELDEPARPPPGSARSSPASRSARARSGTGSGWPSVRRSACAPRA